MATMASVAANDIWNEGCRIDSGVSTSTASAAAASVRSVSAGRSTSTPKSTSAIMMNERCVATSAPESTR